MFSFKKIQFLVPMLLTKLESFIDHKKISKMEKRRNRRMTILSNKRHRVKKLSELTIWDQIWVIDKRVYAKVIDIDENPNLYYIKIENSSNSVIRRNRWHLIYASYREDMKLVDNFEVSIVQDDEERLSDSKHSDTEQAENKNSKQNRKWCK